MKYLLLSLAILCSAALSASEYNTPVNYDFAELRIGQFTVDGVPAGLEDSGLYIAGGGEGHINENVLYSVFYEGAVIDDSLFLLVQRSIAAGLLYRNPLSPKTDLVVGGYVAYIWTELDIPSIPVYLTDNDVGFGASLGVRHGIDDKNELGLEAFYASAFDDSNTSLTASYTHYTEGIFGIGARLSTSSDQTTFALSFKWKTK